MTELRTHGGAGGTSARLEDLDRVAGALRGVATGLAEAGARLAAAAAQPGWLATSAASPGTFAVAEAELVRAAVGVSGLALRLEARGDGVSLAARAYRSADAAASALIRGTAAAVARAAGFALAGRTAPLVVGLVAVRFTPVRHPARPGPLAGSPAGVGPPAEPNRLLNELVWQVVRHGRFGQEVLSLVPPAVDGATFGALPGPLPAAVLGTPRDSVAEVAALLGLVGAASGRSWLTEPATPPRVRLAPGPSAGVPPRGAADLVAGIPSTAGPAAPRVRLRRIDHADGHRSWIVAIPGTSNWSPHPGPHPFDLTGNVQLMAGRRTAAESGVLAAMRQAGVRPGEPVLLAGHSQGGIIAAELAADPSTRRQFHVTQLLTSGAPVAAVHVPESVHVLSIEHDQDPVPQLDTATNPDRPGWLTVSADVGDDPRVREAHDELPLIAHDQRLYRQTAALVDASGDESVARWRQGAADFLDPAATVTDFDASITRVTPAGAG